MAPLDWGLGHTTRCLPLLRQLQLLGAVVFFAGNDKQIAFVRRQMPELHFLDLPGYEVQYARSGSGFLPKMLLQMPRLLRRVSAEHQWLLKTVAEHKIEGIISDNRYGLWHPEVPTVILCHQLALHTGMGAFADKTATLFHQKLLSKFGAVWIPDVATAPGLSGKLGHPENLPAGATYVGPLSQFGSFLPADFPSRKEPQKLVVILSGPEPQRSILSDLLWPQLSALGLPAVFIEGKAEVPVRTSTDTVKWHSLLAGKELQTVLEAASYVVCRGGYTTLMDAAELGLKLIIIPTPGQGEQEYLGRFLAEKGQGLCFSQQGFDLAAAIEKAAHFPFAPLLSAGKAVEVFKFVLEKWYSSF